MPETRRGLTTLTMLGASLMLSACAVGPDYETPALSLPTQWLGLGNRDVSAGEAPLGNLAWWRTFNDPTLDQLIEKAVAANGDLRVAQARLAEARANRLAATAALLPQIDANAGINRGETATSGRADTVSSATFDASWEIDLFGGNRRAAEAARALVGAEQAALQSVRVSLLAEVVRSYLDVRQLQQQTLLTQRNLSIQDETLRIVKAQYAEGVASGLDMARIEAQTASTAAQLPAAQQALTAAMNSLGVLVGEQPAGIAALVSATHPVPVSTPQVLVDTPARVIAARPDVRLAERQLAAATANQGVALSNWFPRLSVAGLFGLADSRNNGSGTIWNAGGAIALPLIDFGRVRALVRVADAQQQQALAIYEQTVLAALADVETSLKGYANAQARVQDLRRADDANKRAVELAQARYREGTVALLDVLVAQQQQFASESARASGEAAVGQSLAALYKALGGAAEPSPTVAP